MHRSYSFGINAVFAFILAFLMPVTVFSQEKVALPSNIDIVAPSESVAAEARPFSGKWYGVWDDTLEHILVVEEISGPEAVVFIYGYGAAPSWGIQKPGWARVKGVLEGETLKGTLRNGATVTYKLQPDGTLKGSWERQGNVARATLRKLN